MKVDIPVSIRGRVKQITQTSYIKNNEKSDVVYYRYSPKGMLFEAVHTLYHSNKPSKIQYLDSFLRNVSTQNRLRFYINGIKAVATIKHSNNDIIKWMEAYEFINQDMPIHLNKYDQKIRLIYDDLFPLRYKNRFDGNILVERSEYKGNDLISDEQFDQKGNLLRRREYRLYEDYRTFNYRSRPRLNHINKEKLFQYDENDNLTREEVISYSLKVEGDSILSRNYKEILLSKSVIEYKYKYDKYGNWTTQFQCSNNREVVLKQREIIYYHTFNGKSDGEQENLNNEEYLRFLAYCRLQMTVNREEFKISEIHRIGRESYNEKKALKGTPDVNSRFLGKDYLYRISRKTEKEDKAVVFFWLYNYYSFNKYKMLEKEQAEVRRIVWDFKDGAGVYTVAQNLVFASFHAKIPLDNTCLIIIPASNQSKTERRLKLFCTKLSDLLHIHNSYDAITTDTHKQTKGQSGGDKISFFTFNPEYYKGKNVFLFDDVFTTGTTFSQVATELRKTGALRIIGVFLAKTIN